MAKQKVVVARYHELKDGQMKEVKAGDTDLLLARVDGEYFALFPKCTHYGAPLVQGALNGDRLVCPWHQACFNVRNGRHLEAPGCDGLPSFPVTVEGEEVVVALPAEIPESETNPMSAYEPSSKEVYAIIGAGAAGAYAAEGMREAGFTGKIVMITAEEEIPYDRPNCSKDFLSGDAPEEWMPLRSADFYRKNGIELLTGKRVERLDAEAKRISFADDTAIGYDKALLCTGGTPRKLNMENTDADNVFTLRSLADSRRIREVAADARTAVVIGSSFIGMESAMSLHKQGCKVTVVSPDEVPFQRFFGARIGQLIQRKHEENGISFRLKQKVKLFEKAGSRVTALRLEDDSVLTADLVLIGIGVTPATGMVRDLEKAEDGSFLTDEYLHVKNDLYAAGDVARYPVAGGSSRRIEHWKVACQQGRVAGMNMAGAQRPYTMVPFFWTNQPGINLGYAGYAESFDDIIYDGDLIEGRFLAFYVKDEAIQAVLGAGRGADLAAIRELMRKDGLPSPDRIGTIQDWTTLLP